MTKTSPEKLAYMKAYNKTPKRKEAGVELRRERRHEIAAGKVAIGDGNDISHKVAYDNGGVTAKGNLKIQPASKNRDWRKGQKGYKVGTDK